jgi:tetratricopeptide (TPR) repeat protein
MVDPKPVNEEAENRKIKGNEFLKEKKYDDAVREYNKAISADPENPTYYSNRAAAWVGNEETYDIILIDKRYKMKNMIVGWKIVSMHKRIREEMIIHTYYRAKNKN